MNAVTPWSVFTFAGSNYDGEQTFTTRQRARVFARQLRAIGVSTNIVRGNSKQASRLRMRILQPQGPRIVIVDNTKRPEFHLSAPPVKAKKTWKWRGKRSMQMELPLFSRLGVG